MRCTDGDIKSLDKWWCVLSYIVVLEKRFDSSGSVIPPSHRRGKVASIKLSIKMRTIIILILITTFSSSVIGQEVDVAFTTRSASYTTDVYFSSSPASYTTDVYFSSRPASYTTDIYVTTNSSSCDVEVNRNSASYTKDIYISTRSASYTKDIYLASRPASYTKDIYITNGASGADYTICFPSGFEYDERHIAAIFVLYLMKKE